MSGDTCLGNGNLEIVIIVKERQGKTEATVVRTGQLSFSQLLRKSEQFIKRSTGAHFLVVSKFNKY